MKEPLLIEDLADYAHEAWSGWMRHLFLKSHMNQDGSAKIPADLVLRWQRQMTTKYNDLPEGEKESDRDEAKAILRIAGARSPHLKQVIYNHS